MKVLKMMVIKIIVLNLDEVMSIIKPYLFMSFNKYLCLFSILNQIRIFFIFYTNLVY